MANTEQARQMAEYRRQLRLNTLQNLKNGGASQGIQTNVTPPQQTTNFVGDIAKTVSNFGESLNETGLDIVGHVSKGLFKGLEGIYDAGAGLVGTVGGWFSENFEEKVKNHIAIDGSEKVFGWLYEATDDSYINKMGEKGQNITRGVAQGIGQMLPSIIVTVVTHGAGASTMASQIAGMGTFAAGATGGATEEAVQGGADLGQAVGYGIASGALETAIEKASGNVPWDDIAKGAIKSAGKSALSKATSTFFSEGVEEVASDVLNPALKRVTGVDREATIDYSKLPETFAIGGLTGVTMGGASRGITNLKYNKAGGSKFVSMAEELDSIRENEVKLAEFQENKKHTAEQVEDYAKRVDTDNYESIQRISETLKSLPANKRGNAFLTAPDLHNIFEANGEIKADIQNNFKDVSNMNVSAGIRHQTSKLNEVLKGVNERHNTNFELDTDKLNDTERTTLAKVTNAVSRLAKSSKYKAYAGLDVAIIKNAKNENAFIKDGVIYLSREHLSSGEWAKHVAHEVTHFTEGSKEYNAFAKFLTEDAQAVNRASEAISKQGYGYTAEQVKNALAKVNRGETLTESEQEAYSELISHIAEEILGNEDSINRLTAKNKSLANRIYERIKSFIKAFTGTNADKETVARLRKAEKLFAKALENTGKAQAEMVEQAKKDYEEEQKQSKTLDNEPAVAYSRRDKLGYNETQKYLKYSTLGANTVEQLWHKILGITRGVSDCIANGVAIEDNDTIYVVDFGKDNNKLSFGVIRRLRYADKELLSLDKEDINDRALSKGNISEELLEKFGYSSDNGSGSNIGRFSRKELSTDNGESQDNKERVSKGNGVGRVQGLKFSLKIGNETATGKVEETNNLVALHNLSEDNLLRVIELDGFPMPSIAVTKTELPHENYGNITVVFGRDTIDPKLDERNVVYDRDAWTPTTPKVEVKLNNQAVSNLINELQESIKDNSVYKRNVYSFFDGKYRDNNGDYVIPEYDYKKDLIGKQALRHNGIIAAYLSEQGVSVEPEYREKGFTMGWTSYTREQAANLFDFVGVTKDITRENATEEQRKSILEKLIKYRAKEKLGTMRRFSKNAQITLEQVEEILKGEYNDGNVSQLFFMAEDFFDEHRPKDIYDEYATNEKLQSHISDKQDFYDWIFNKIDSTFEKKGIDNDTDVFDSRGNRRSFEKRHYNYTAENIVKAMSKGEQEGKGTWGVTAGSLAAKLSKQFSSIEDIRDAKEYLALVPEEDLKAFNDKTYELYDELVSEIAGSSSDTFSDMSRREDVGEILGKCASVKPLTVENIKRMFDKETRGYNLNYKFNLDIANKALTLFESLKRIPTTYFEAKPRRVVKFNEIKKVLIPTDASEKLIKALDKKKIDYVKYNNEKTRSNIINEIDDIRFSRKEVQQGETEFLTEMPQEKKTIREKVVDNSKETWINLQTQFTNQQAGLEKELKRLGVEEAEAKTHLARASYNAGQIILEEGFIDENGNVIGKSLQDIWNPVYKKGEEYQREFNEYLFNYLHIDRLKVDKGILNNVTEEQAKERIAQLEAQHPEFKALAKDVWQYNKNLMKERIKLGLVTDEVADYMNNMYPHYVPAFTEGQENKQSISATSSNNTVKQTIKGAKGSVDNKLPPDVIMARQTMEVMRAGRLNQLLNSLYNGVLNKKDNTNVSVIKIEQRWQPNKTEDAIKEAKKNANEVLDLMNEDYSTYDNQPHQYTFYRGSEKITISVSDDIDIGLSAFKPNQEYRNTLINLVTKGNDIFKRLVTSANPFFLGRNAIRDLQEALFYSKDAKRFIGYLVKAYKQIIANGEFWRMYKSLGGMSSGLFDYNTGIQRFSGVKGVYKKALAKLEKANMIVEQAPRLAEFIISMEKGASAEQALLDSAEVTTNFSRGGKTAKFLNRTVMPFLNPSIQGWSKLYRTVTGKKTIQEWGMLILKALVLGIGVSALNDLLLGDDEEYQSLSIRDKENNYLIKIGDNFLKLPKGRVLSVFGSLWIRGREQAKGNENAWDGYLSSVSSAVSPVDSFTRTIFSPLNDAKTNTTWYGTKIEGQKFENVAVTERYDESTSTLAVAIGKAMGWSPKKVHYVIDQYSGVIGDILLPATTPKAERNFITSNLFIDTTMTNRYANDFYTALDEANYAKSEGDINATYIVRYLNSISTEVSDMYAEQHKIQSSKKSNKEKTEEVKVLQTLINATNKSAVANAKVLKQTLTEINVTNQNQLLLNNAKYKKLDETMQKKAIQKLNDYYYALAMNKAFGIELEDKYLNYSKFNSPELFVYLSEISAIGSDKDKQGNAISGSRKAKIIKYLKSKGVTSAKQDIILDILGYLTTTK